MPCCTKSTIHASLPHAHIFVSDRHTLTQYTHKRTVTTAHAIHVPFSDGRIQLPRSLWLPAVSIRSSIVTTKNRRLGVGPRMAWFLALQATTAKSPPGIFPSTCNLLTSHARATTQQHEANMAFPLLRKANRSSTSLRSFARQHEQQEAYIKNGSRTDQFYQDNPQ